MRNIRNRLLVAWILLTVTCGICVHVNAEARGSYTYQTRSIGSVRPIVAPASGEPDDGGGRQLPHPNDDPGVIITPQTVGGWIFLIWVSSRYTRYSGAGW